MLFNYNFYCPHCNSLLKRGSTVQFNVKNEKNEHAEMEMSPLPGVYSYKVDKEISIKKGDLLSFHCISCNKNLKSINYPEFVGIILRVTDDIHYEVLFSPICGKRTTYVVMDGQLERYERSFFNIRMNQAG